MKKTIFAAILLASITTLSAQNPENRRPRPQGEQRQRITPEMRAQEKTDRMKKTLDLTDKQYKKLYNLNLQEAQDQQQAMRGQRPQGNRPQGMRLDGGDGRPQMGGGRPDTPRPQGMQPGQPQLSKEQLQKNAEKREKKIKKILGDEKYQRWQDEAKKLQERPQQFQGQQRPQSQQRPRPQQPK